jgi:hypothetical protein
MSSSDLRLICSKVPIPLSSFTPQTVASPKLKLLPACNFLNLAALSDFGCRLCCWTLERFYCAFSALGSGSNQSSRKEIFYLLFAHLARMFMISAGVNVTLPRAAATCWSIELRSHMPGTSHRDASIKLER